MPHPKPLPTPNQSADRTLPHHSSLVHLGRQLFCLPLLHLLAAGPPWSLVSHCCFCLCSGGGAPAQASNLLSSRFPLSSCPQALASRMEWNTVWVARPTLSLLQLS